MEHTANAVVVPLDAGWNDIGSWDALWEISEKDPDNNTLIGDVVAKDVENSYVWSEGRLVVAAGLKNVVIVETADAVMVVSKGRSQQVKSIVAELKDEGRVEGILHQKVFRPWGCYEVLDADKGFLLKRITVNPRASLSLQLHEHRAEHWVVVSGTATVTIEDEITDLKPGKSCYIPLQTRHRLQNLTNEQLVVVEVQSGVYLSEDDIIRIEDKYGR
jgi:mannose-1-phosphate guanylyltransferase/mannose-6-phosphate isomerase